MGTNDTENQAISIEMGGPEGTSIRKEDDEAISSEVSMDGVADDAENGAADDTSQNDDATDDLEDATDSEDGSGEEEESEEVGEVEDLGEFDPEDPEAWDQQYRTEDGEINKDVLTAEFYQNEGKGLNDGTYAYLESMGISKAMAKDVEAALVTRNQAEEAKNGDAAVFAAAQSFVGEGQDGTETLKAALEWGKKGGYDKKAQARFNKVMQGKDGEAKVEATELLLSRYNRAQPAKNKPKVPKRDITAKAGRKPGGIQPFKSRDEYREAIKEAKGNQKAIKLAAQRAAVSNF